MKIRLDPKVQGNLKKIAKQLHRSMNKQISVYVEQGLLADMAKGGKTS